MTYFLDPFGCVKNQVDAENMMAFLNREGWAAAENAETSDLIIINSCGFIESAKRESINAVLGWKKLYPNKKILLAGCLAQRYSKELERDLPEADGIFGTEDLSGITCAVKNLIGITADNTSGNGAQDRLTAEIKARHETNSIADTGKRPLLSLPGSAYVKISEGCNNRCSFCAIPLIRGGLASRPLRDVTEECKELLGRGIKELCLIGQDTGSYGRDWREAGGSSPAITILLETLSRLKGNFWIRLLYIHPDNFPVSILDIMENDKRILPYFDIPFQHASDKILKAMRRRGNAASYLELIETVRQRLPDAVIRSTFMTGFPGETEEDFRALMDFQTKACLDWLGCFSYSREEDTESYTMKGRVSKKTSSERKQLIEERQVAITEKQMERFIGRTFDVLVEEKFDPLSPSAGDEPQEEPALYLGRLPGQAPEVDGAAVISSLQPLKLGVIVPCRVIARAGFDLEVQPL